MTKAEEHEAMRRWVETWKRAGPELERIKMEELQAITEEESAEMFCGLDIPPEFDWMPPEDFTSSGLVEQQRLFMLWHDRASRPSGRS